MRNVNIERVQMHPESASIAVKGGRPKTIRGVCTVPQAVYMTSESGHQALYDVVAAGRFAVEVNEVESVALWFKPITESEVAIIMPTAPTVVEGDIENTFTTVSHRPAVNPEMQAVLRQMRLMQGELQRLSMPRRVEPRAAPAAPPSTPPATPEQAAVTAVVEGEGA